MNCTNCSKAIRTANGMAFHLGWCRPAIVAPAPATRRTAARAINRKLGIRSRRRGPVMAYIGQPDLVIVPEPTTPEDGHHALVALEADHHCILCVKFEPEPEPEPEPATTPEPTPAQDAPQTPATTHIRVSMYEGPLSSYEPKLTADKLRRLSPVFRHHPRADTRRTLDPLAVSMTPIDGWTAPIDALAPFDAPTETVRTYVRVTPRERAALRVKHAPHVGWRIVPDPLANARPDSWTYTFLYRSDVDGARSVDQAAA